MSRRRRRQSPEKEEEATKTIQGLFNANFISKVKYTKRLSNVVLVKKVLGNWRMRVDYPDLNKACPKDSYWVASINNLVDRLFQIQAHMNAYSSYNKIPMYEPGKGYTFFKIEQANY